jgi:tetratricopeptide (TPR) repeat protein
MGRIEKTVFISYRRTNIPWALAIFQNLTQFGFDVFFDFTGIASGDFENAILENIHARAHFLVLLTPSALERCGDPSDWLRREIEAALESRRNIVPLMLEGFDFGTPAIANQLTGKLAKLKQYNALNIPADYFLEAMGRLRDRYLNVALDAVLHPASRSAVRAGTEEKAAAAMAPAVTEEELTAQQWFERGLDATDPDEKVRFYNQAIRLKPDYARAFCHRGVVFYQHKGDLKGALEDFDEAIRLEPDYANAFVGRSRTRRKMGDAEGALQDYKEAIRLKPDDSPSFNNRAIARLDMGDLEGALQDYDEAIRLKPDNAKAFSNRGYARYLKGDLEGALHDCEEAIRLKPDFAPAFAHRGIARRAKGDLEGAAADFDAVIRLKSDYATALANRDAVRSGIAERSKTSSHNE